MSKSVKVLALKIAQILEEHSEQELRDAVRLLREYGRGESLLRYLGGDSASLKPASRQRASDANSESPKSSFAAASRAVLRIKDSEPEKYEVLSEFDRVVRSGAILRTNEALRRFGEQISKSFEPRKSRKESIGAVMEVLAACSLPEIHQQIDAAQTLEGEKSGEYQRLAEFLIKGKS